MTRRTPSRPRPPLSPSACRCTPPFCVPLHLPLCVPLHALARVVAALCALAFGARGRGRARGTARCYRCTVTPLQCYGAPITLRGVPVPLTVRVWCSRVQVGVRHMVPKGYPCHALSRLGNSVSSNGSEPHHAPSVACCHGERPSPAKMASVPFIGAPRGGFSSPCTDGSAWSRAVPRMRP